MTLVPEDEEKKPVAGLQPTGGRRDDWMKLVYGPTFKASPIPCNIPFETNV